MYNRVDLGAIKEWGRGRATMGEYYWLAAANKIQKAMA